MKDKINVLQKELKQFSSRQPNPKLNSATNAFYTSTDNSFFFATDFHFNKSIAYLENLEKKSSDKIRVAVLLGESFYLSMLPELQKHVDLVLLVDINPKVLQAMKYMYELMDKHESCTGFAEEFSDETKNIFTTSNWTTFAYRTSDPSQKIEIPITQKIVLTQLLNNNKMLGEKHFIETDQRYVACRNNLKKLAFDFLLLDLLNDSLVNELKNILERNDAIITVMNINNLLDYDADRAIRTVNFGEEPWAPSGRLYNNLKRLAEKQPSPIVLFSRLDQKEEFKSLTSCQARSVDHYIELTQAYIKEINQFLSPASTSKNTKNAQLLSQFTVITTKTPSAFGSAFKTLNPSSEEKQQIQHEIETLAGSIKN